MDADEHGLRAKLWMTGDERVAIALHDDGVLAVPRFNAQHALGRELPQVDTTLDLAADDVAVDVIA